MITALLDHLWQSTLFAVCAGALTLAYRNNSAQIRYWLWFAASVKFLVPFSLLAAGGEFLVQSFSRPVVVPFGMAGMGEVAQPFSSSALPILDQLPGTRMNLAATPVAVWAIGFVAVLFHWFVRWRRVRVALRSATPLSLTVELPLPVKCTTLSFEPGLVGIWKPVLLLPEGILARLSPREMTAILAHEVCHMRRRDNLTAAIHMIVEAVFWFYPLVWWLGARLIAERERACDEAVVTAGSDPQVYAEGILKVCKFYVQSPLACASGVSGADLRKRVEEIMINRIKVRVNLAKKVFLAATAAAAVALPLAAGFVVWPAAQAKTGADAMSIAERTQEMARRRAEQRLPRTAVPFDPVQFDKYAGTYQGDRYMFITFSREGEHFFGVPVGAPEDQKMEFYPESPTKFFAKGGPIQINFVADAKGKVEGLVVHSNGFELFGPKVDEPVVKAALAELAGRIKSRTPSRGTEAALRRFIDDFRDGKPSYDEMDPQHAALVNGQLAKYVDYFQKWGALKSLTFVEVNSRGLDKYLAVYEHASAEMLIDPLTPAGKIEGVQIGKVEAQ